MFKRETAETPFDPMERPAWPKPTWRWELIAKLRKAELLIIGDQVLSIYRPVIRTFAEDLRKAGYQVKISQGVTQMSELGQEPEKQLITVHYFSGAELLALAKAEKLDLPSNFRPDKPVPKVTTNFSTLVRLDYEEKKGEYPAWRWKEPQIRVEISEPEENPVIISLTPARLVETTYAVRFISGKFTGYHLQAQVVSAAVMINNITNSFVKTPAELDAQLRLFLKTNLNQSAPDLEFDLEE